MDSALLLSAKTTCALILAPGSQDYGGARAVCVNSNTAQADSPFGDATVLSLGWIITALMVIPFSLRNLGVWRRMTR